MNPKLQGFYVASNQFYDISSISFITASRNLLHGSLPLDLGSTLPKLYSLSNKKVQTTSLFNFGLPKSILQLSYRELFHATNGFSAANLIGKRGYGSVYKGFLNFGEQIVAVKVLNLYECGANKSFVIECEALKNIRQRNLVKIITSCSSIDFGGNDFKALVFEFMENGSLESWPSNILLDGDLCAHVSDFGLAKIFLATTGVSNHQQSSSIGIKGTIGYVAPEYGMVEEVSTQSDMYSYGVLLLEMFTGKRPTNNMFTGNVNLYSYEKMCLSKQVMQIVDPQIILKIEEEPSKPSKSKQSSTTNISKLEAYLVPVFQIGVSCSIEILNDRLSVKDVIKELHKIRNAFLGVRGKRH
ncbi:hypothetical protein ACSBR1_041204 [Camellia fascicularis]